LPQCRAARFQSDQLKGQHSTRWLLVGIRFGSHHLAVFNAQILPAVDYSACLSGRFDEFRPPGPLLGMMRSIVGVIDLKNSRSACQCVHRVHSQREVERVTDVFAAWTRLECTLCARARPQPGTSRSMSFCSRRRRPDSTQKTRPRLDLRCAFTNATACLPSPRRGLLFPVCG